MRFSCRLGLFSALFAVGLSWNSILMGTEPGENASDAPSNQQHDHPEVENSEAAQLHSLPKHAGLSPREAAEAMTVPEGFQVELVAGEPTVHQPVAFAIDDRGRLWVAEAHTYPIRAPEGQGKDKILILEDSDGDGTFETRKIFIDGLNLVSGLEVGFGGVWIGAAPYLMFIPDRDRDDRPDGPPEILLDGWGYQDTHETLNAFIWGPDGWLYGCQGVFTHSKIGKPGAPDSERTPLNAGVWRYHPVRHEFEVFAWGTSNPWGVDFNDHGQAFITACVIPHLYHVIQGARYQRQAGKHFNPYVYDDIKTIADHLHYAGNIRDHAWWGRDNPVAHSTTDKAGGGHAHCGAMIYLGDNWPDSYRNSLFMANIHGNRINNDILERRGSGFVGRHGPDFLYANDRWFRGINLKYGPDGGVYLIDWYDPNACHRRNPEIWDRTNGRVYKVTFGTAEPQKVHLAKLDDQELVKLHLHKNDWFVRTARRILQDRAARGELAEGTHRALQQILENHPDIPRKLRALWTLHVTNGLSQETATELLNHDNEYLRAWTIQLLLEDQKVPQILVARLASMSRTDDSPVVRLYLASALQRLPLDSRWSVAEGLLQHASDAEDHNLPLMIWYGVEPLVMRNTTRTMELARKSQILRIFQYIVRRAASDPEGLNHVLASLLETNDSSAQNRVLTEVTEILKNRGQLKMPPAWPRVFAKLSKSESQTIRTQAQFITVKFGDQSIFPELRGIVADPQADLPSRRQALDTLLSGQDPELPPLLHRLLDHEQLRATALRGLARYDHPATPKAILEHYRELTPTEQSDAITTLSSRRSYAAALLDAVAREQVPRDHLSAFTVRQIHQLGDSQLTDTLNKVWGTIRAASADKKKLMARYERQLRPRVLAEADLQHGRVLFQQTCAKCHKLFGEGTTIGPDITGSNRANLQYILENILDPNAVVGRDYEMTVVATEDGRVVSGLIREENDSALILQTVNEEVVIPLEKILERSKSSVSMMPEGQLEKMTPHDVRDLIAYLGSPSQVPLPGEGPFLNPTTGRVAGAIEGEAMTVVGKTAGDARSQKMQDFPQGTWSGTDHLWWTGAQPGDQLTLTLPVSDEGRYEIFAVMTKARDYGVVQFSLDEKKIGQPIDLYNSPHVITTDAMSLGTHLLSAGDHTLTVQIVGAHPDAVKSYMFGLDYIYLAKETQEN